MRDYELVAMINPEVDEEGVSRIIDTVAESINNRGGTVEETKQWGKRKLAYPIEKFMEADYVLTRFKLGPKAVKELETEVGASRDILRYLVVKLDD
ncbi:MAG: 30S ribosomal protein S6 [Dehalococcoidia bacterium]|nr:30S ribosomal protein S6 [Dehalococcoidia bacterium]